MNHPEEGCSCTWSDLGPPGVRFISRRDRHCGRHGDGTEWWRKVQDRAKALGAKYVGERDD